MERVYSRYRTLDHGDLRGCRLRLGACMLWLRTRGTRRPSTYCGTSGKGKRGGSENIGRLSGVSICGCGGKCLGVLSSGKWLRHTSSVVPIGQTSAGACPRRLVPHGSSKSKLELSTLTVLIFCNSARTFSVATRLAFFLRSELVNNQAARNLVDHYTSGWLAQPTPTRLYRVMAVIPSSHMALRDELHPLGRTVIVKERSGSRPEFHNITMGCRVVQVGGQFEIAGACYLIPPILEATLMDTLANTTQPADFGRAIRRAWWSGFHTPQNLPAMLDSHSWERIQLTTHYYRCLDIAELGGVLHNAPGVEGRSRARARDVGIWLNKGKRLPPEDTLCGRAADRFDRVKR
jgi:hypothetical protein